MQHNLEYHRNRLLQQSLPQYEQLGSLTCVYLLGSLVSGYTTDSDLDIMMVWDGTAVPAGQRREELVARLDERQRTPPFVVDYYDIHLERYTIADQEYNVAHLPLTIFQTMIQLVLDGTWNRSDQQLNLLTAAAGFSYGELLLDRAQIGQQLKAALSTFPDAVKQETRRVVQARRQRYLSDLGTFAARADWLMFHSVMLDAVRTTLQALFAANNVYYPGDKWLRQSIRRFGLNTKILTLFDRLWEPVESAHERIAALRRLMGLVDG